MTAHRTQLREISRSLWSEHEAIPYHRPHSRSPFPWQRVGRRGRRWVEKVDRKTRYLRTLKPRVPSGPAGMRTTLLGKLLPFGAPDFAWILFISCVIFSSGLFSSPRILLRASAYSCSRYNSSCSHTFDRTGRAMQLHTCFRDLIGCLGLSSFNGPSPLPSLVGLFNIFTIGFGGTYWDLRPSSPSMIILVLASWLVLHPKGCCNVYMVHGKWPRYFSTALEKHGKKRTLETFT